MNFLQFKEAIYREAFPQKEAQRLDARHEGWIKACLIELQQKIKCLQLNHKEYITLPATYFSCGASVFAAPHKGYIRSLRVQETANNCRYVDAIPYTEAQFRGILQNLQNCSCDAPYGYEGAYLPGYAYSYDVEEDDPELQPSSVENDRSTNPTDRAYAMFDGNIWLWPVLQSTETAILRWDGVKRNWRNTDEIPWVDEAGSVDREVQQVVTHDLLSKYYQFDDCEPQKSASAYALYVKKVAEMMVDCRRQMDLESQTRIIPGC